MSSSKEPETLQEFLDAWYREYVISSKQRPIGLIDSFKAKAEQNTSLLTEARAKLKGLDGISDDRCFISKIHRDFLKQATT
jgi:hypothetical protein